VHHPGHEDQVTAQESSQRFGAGSCLGPLFGVQVVHDVPARSVKATRLTQKPRVVDLDSAAVVRGATVSGETPMPRASTWPSSDL